MGPPCKHHGNVKRFVSTGACIICNTLRASGWRPGIVGTMELVERPDFVSIVARSDVTAEQKLLAIMSASAREYQRRTTGGDGEYQTAQAAARLRASMVDG